MGRNFNDCFGGFQENNIVTLQNIICKVERGGFPSQQNRLKIKFLCTYKMRREKRDRNNTHWEAKEILRARPILSSLEAKFNSPSTGLPPILEGTTVTLRTATHKPRVQAHTASRLHERKPQLQWTILPGVQKLPFQDALC